LIKSYCHPKNTSLKNQLNLVIMTFYQVKMTMALIKYNITPIFSTRMSIKSI